MTDKTPAMTETEIRENIAVKLMERHGLTLCDGAVNEFTIGVKVKPELTDFGYRLQRNGKMRVTIGDNWSYMGIFKTKSYPQRKDGTHSYDKIADELARMYEIVKARANAKAQLDGKKLLNEGTLSGIRMNLKVKDTKLSVCPRTGCIVFKLFDVKASDAAKFAELAKELGYLTEE